MPTLQPSTGGSSIRSRTVNVESRALAVPVIGLTASAPDDRPYPAASDTRLAWYPRVTRTPARLIPSGDLYAIDVRRGIPATWSAVQESRDHDRVPTRYSRSLCQGVVERRKHDTSGNEQRNVTIATSIASGQPHAAVVSGASARDAATSPSPTSPLSPAT